MDEITEDRVDQEDIVGSHCSVREYRAAREEFFAAVEEYRRASEEYLEALEANHSNRSGVTSDAHKAEQENLEEKRLKREAALLAVVTNLQLAKSTGEGMSLDF